ncbi:hypothetical protein F7725_014808 [Dissostichus mawsoni]|uniref:NHL repeat-containing protein 3 n=1 Tax=Dissostichus mawsoni TaxID=36200 RepID=A0A7J5YXC1_DISMA|nr:hypothetical protein F7725_014808 [Dissostichus mawsoni]
MTRKLKVKKQPLAKPLMLNKKRGHTCLLASGMAALVLLMVVLYGTIGPQQASGSILRPGYVLRGSPLYQLDLSWPRKPELFSGQVFGVAVNQNAGVVLVFSTEGEFLMSWNTTTLEMPHGIFLADAASANPTVWITDVGNGPYGHSVKQYSPSGKLLQVLGAPGKAGSGMNPLQFDQPAEIFVHPSGEMYIMNRLIKLSKDHEVMWMHGEKGQGMAQFYIPHSVTVDDYHRVWVADRGNKRIQVFNSITGEWLGTWGSCFSEDAPTPSANPRQELNTNQISLLEAPPVGLIGQCRVVSVIQLAEEVKPHLVDLDLKTGALYVAEIGAQQAQKFTPFRLGGNFL